MCGAEYNAKMNYWNRARYLVATALAEKISALMTREYLERRAARASREKFERALSKVPSITPDEQDKF